MDAKNAISPKQATNWLRRLGANWTDTGIYDRDGAPNQTLYQLVRTGYVEVEFPVAVGTADGNSEVWTTASVAGRWDKMTVSGDDVRAAGGVPAPVHYGAYRRARLTDAGMIAQRRLPILPELSIVPGRVQIGPLRVVSTVFLVYDRSHFVPGSRQPIPVDSVVDCLRVQGMLRAVRGASLINLAEYEDVNAVLPDFPTAAQAAYHFRQAWHAFDESLNDLRHRGCDGLLTFDFNEPLISRAAECANRMHQAGSVLLRIGAKCIGTSTAIASAIADPLRAHQHIEEALRDATTIAATADAINPPSPTPPEVNLSPTPNTAGIPPQGNDDTADGYRLVSRFIKDYPDIVPDDNRMTKFLREHAIPIYKPKKNRKYAHIAKFIAAVDKVRALKQTAEAADDDDETDADVVRKMEAVEAEAQRRRSVIDAGKRDRRK